MEVFETILLGIVSGMITTVLLTTCIVMFNKVLTPWYEQRVYKGVDISGPWNGTYSSQNYRRDLFLNIDQKAHNIKGSFQAKSVQNGREYINHYNVEGIIRDNYVIINYFALQKNRTGLGSFLLKVCHGGTKLEGGASFIAENIDRISTENQMTFTRS